MEIRFAMWRNTVIYLLLKHISVCHLEHELELVGVTPNYSPAVSWKDVAGGEVREVSVG